jgi:hypothetical protein
VVVVDLPEASSCCESILDVMLVNHGTQVTTLSLVMTIMTGQDLGIQFDGRLPERDQASLLASLDESRDHLREALAPLLIQKKFIPCVIGAEIDEESESLWVWLDDPENPM